MKKRKRKKKPPPLIKVKMPYPQASQRELASFSLEAVSLPDLIRKIKRVYDLEERGLLQVYPGTEKLLDSTLIDLNRWFKEGYFGDWLSCAQQVVHDVTEHTTWNKGWKNPDLPKLLPDYEKYINDLLNPPKLFDNDISNAVVALDNALNMVHVWHDVYQRMSKELGEYYNRHDYISCTTTKELWQMLDFIKERSGNGEPVWTPERMVASRWIDSYSGGIGRPEGSQSLSGAVLSQRKIASSVAGIIHSFKKFYEMLDDGHLDSDWLDNHVSDTVFIYDFAKSLADWYEIFIKKLIAACRLRVDVLEKAQHPEWAGIKEDKRVAYDAINSISKYKEYLELLRNAYRRSQVNWMVIAIDNIANSMHVDIPMFDHLLMDAVYPSGWQDPDMPDSDELLDELAPIINWLYSRTNRYNWVREEVAKIASAEGVIKSLKKFYEMQDAGHLDPDWLDRHVGDTVFVYDLARNLSKWYGEFIGWLEDSVSWRKDSENAEEARRAKRAEQALPQYEEYLAFLNQYLKEENLSWVIIYIDNIVSSMHIDLPMLEHLLGDAANEAGIGETPHDPRYEELQQIVDWLYSRTNRIDWNDVKMVARIQAHRKLAGRILYHVTTNKSKVLEEGLKTRNEIGLEKGLGLGGGEGDLISFTNNYEDAVQIYDTLVIARRFFANEIGIQDLIRYAKEGVGAPKPYIDEFFNSKEWDADAWEHGYAIKRDKDKEENWKGPFIDEGEARDSVEPCSSNDVVTLDDGVYVKCWYEYPLPEGEGHQSYDEWGAAQVFKNWLKAREEVGGVINPVLVHIDVKALGQIPEGEIGILEYSLQDKPDTHIENWENNKDKGMWFYDATLSTWADNLQTFFGVTWQNMMDMDFDPDAIENLMKKQGINPSKMESLKRGYMSGWFDIKDKDDFELTSEGKDALRTMKKRWDEMFLHEIQLPSGEWAEFRRVIAEVPPEPMQEYRTVEELAPEFIGGRPQPPRLQDFEKNTRDYPTISDQRDAYNLKVHEWKKQESAYRRDKLKRLKEEVLKRLPNQIYTAIKNVPFRQGGKTLQRAAWYSPSKNIMYINNYYLSDNVRDLSVPELLSIMGHECWHAFEHNSKEAENFAWQLRTMNADRNLQSYEDYEETVKKHLRPYDKGKYYRGHGYVYYLDKSLREQIENGHLTQKSFSEMMADSLGQLVSGQKGVYPMLENAIFEKFASKSDQVLIGGNYMIGKFTETQDGWICNELEGLPWDRKLLGEPKACATKDEAANALWDLIKDEKPLGGQLPGMGQLWGQRALAVEYWKAPPEKEATITMYHGTWSSFIPDMKSKGIRAVPIDKQIDDVLKEFGLTRADVPADIYKNDIEYRSKYLQGVGQVLDWKIYLTSDFAKASAYAQGGGEVGGLIRYRVRAWLLEQEGEDSHEELWHNKGYRGEIPPAEGHPVVLKLEMPKKWLHDYMEDYDQPGGHTYEHEPVQKEVQKRLDIKRMNPLNFDAETNEALTDEEIVEQERSKGWDFFEFDGYAKGIIPWRFVDEVIDVGGLGFDLGADSYPKAWEMLRNREKAASREDTLASQRQIAYFETDEEAQEQQEQMLSLLQRMKSFDEIAEEMHISKPEVEQLVDWTEHRYRKATSQRAIAEYGVTPSPEEQQKIHEHFDMEQKISDAQQELFNQLKLINQKSDAEHWSMEQYNEATGPIFEQLDELMGQAQHIQPLSWQSYQPEPNYPIEEDSSKVKPNISKEDIRTYEMIEMLRKKQMKPADPGKGPYRAPYQLDQRYMDTQEGRYTV